MEQLQQAEAAIAVGNKKEAYVLLAQVLKQDQKNVDAWIMLSEVADTPEQERLFLEKAARIDPQHETVQARLTALDEPAEPALTELAAEEPAAEELAAEEPAAMKISDDPVDYETQAQGDTLPPWLAGEEQYVALEQATDEIAVAEPDETSPTEPETDVPYWLQDEPEESWLVQTTTTEKPELELEPAGEDVDQIAVVASQPPPEREEKRRKPSPSRGAWYEWAIAVFAILLFLLLIFFIFSR